MRQFISGLPDELIQAARVDGAGELRIFRSVVHAAVRARARDARDPDVPRPRGTTSCGRSWWPRTRSKYTLPVALALYSVGQNATKYGLLLAGVGRRGHPRHRDLPGPAAPHHAGHRDDRHQVAPIRSTPSREKQMNLRSDHAGRARGDDGLAVGSGLDRRRRRPPPPPATGARPSSTERTLRTYAKDTWRSMAAMTDPSTGPAGRQHHRRPRPAHPQQVHLADQHRRLPVEHRRRPRHRPDQPRRRRTGGWRARSTRWRRSTGTTRAGMFYNWYDPHTGAKLRTWPENGTRRQAVPVQRRQRLARHRAAARRARRPGAGQARPTRCARRWTSASTTTPAEQRPRAARSAAASGTRTRTTRSP